MASARGAVGLTLAAASAVFLYVFGVVLPYFVNGLHHLPLSEVANGLHDPKGMWPSTVPYLGGWAHFAGVMSLAFTPLILVLVAAGALWGTAVTVRRERWGVTAAYGLLVLTSTASLAWFFGPTGLALATWQMD